jgi:hypothetical protein
MSLYSFRNCWWVFLASFTVSANTFYFYRKVQNHCHILTKRADGSVVLIVFKGYPPSRPTACDRGRAAKRIFGPQIMMHKSTTVCHKQGRISTTKMNWWIVTQKTAFYSFKLMSPGAPTRIYIQIFYLRWLIKAMREKNINLFPQHIILFPQYIILFPIQDDHQFNIGPYGKYISSWPSSLYEEDI